MFSTVECCSGPTWRKPWTETSLVQEVIHHCLRFSYYKIGTVKMSPFVSLIGIVTVCSWIKLVSLKKLSQNGKLMGNFIRGTSCNEFILNNLRLIAKQVITIYFNHSRPAHSRWNLIFSSPECSWWAIVVSGCPSSVNIWCLHSRDHICDFMKLGLECLFWKYLGQVRRCVMSGQKLGHQVKS